MEENEVVRGSATRYHSSVLEYEYDQYDQYKYDQYKYDQYIVCSCNNNNNNR